MFNIQIAILTGMKHTGMKQYKQVWHELGITSSSMSNIMSGRNTPRLFTLECMATLFKVPLSEFIGWGEQSKDLDKLKGEVLEWQR